VTMHGPKIEHKRRQGEINAAMACGGGTDQLTDEEQDAALRPVTMACSAGQAPRNNDTPALHQ
jgi:hypothetical protein